VLAVGWTAYLNALNQRSCPDHDQLIAFVQVLCKALRAEIPSAADAAALIQSFLPNAYGWILKLSGAELPSGTAPMIKGFDAEPPGTKRTVHWPMSRHLFLSILIWLLQIVLVTALMSEQWTRSIQAEEERNGRRRHMGYPDRKGGSAPGRAAGSTPPATETG
jgi:hypothetical protein